MMTDDMETRLVELGQRWPIPSVADAVQDRLKAIERPKVQLAASQTVASTSTRRRPHWTSAPWTSISAIAAAMIAFVAIYVSMFAAPASLYAQVKESIRKSLSAKMQIVSIDASGARTNSTLWYSRELGVRGEMGDEVFVDDGKQQWSWQAPDNNPSVVSRSASRDGIAMVAESLQLPNEPGAMTRSAEHDHDVNGRKLIAMKIAVKKSSNAIAPANVAEDRVVVWQNDAGKIVKLRSEHRNDAAGQWAATRELNIEYDVEIDRDKFMPHFPESTRIVDEDRVWSDRFPLNKALATAESGGLLFAVHELSRCENGSYYVVSSVRGTSEHLKKHPPKSRPLNLQTTLLDVAEQFCAATTQSDCHVAPIASSEIDGVHYLWWLATDRNYFKLEGDKRVPQPIGMRMESEAGRVRVPLMANYRGELSGSSMVSTAAVVDLARESKAMSLRDVAVQVQRDGALSKTGLLVHTFENATGHYVPASSITADQLVQSLERELQWLNANDELGEVSLGGNDGVPAK